MDESLYAGHVDYCPTQGNQEQERHNGLVSEMLVAAIESYLDSHSTRLNVYLDTLETIIHPADMRNRTLVEKVREVYAAAQASRIALAALVPWLEQGPDVSQIMETVVGGGR